MPKSGKIKNYPLGRVKLRVLERERESFLPPFTYCRNRCFILVGGELINTLSLTLVVPRDMAELYGGRAAAAAWGEGVTLHATLMGVELRSVIPDHLPFGYLIDYRLSPSG
ncbi:hypothetical protein BHM03_00061292 [Ensete ventricosum]|nr:hypothetical protein BHM03_00061292 [Ensete ventricosum]